MIFPTAEYLPDLPVFANPGATVADGVIPDAASYRPLKGMATYSPALDARAQGAIAAQDKDGNTKIYVGNATKLYDVSGTASTDVSKSGGYTVAPDECWEFVKWGNQVFASVITEDVQEITLGGANFADLFTSTAKPKARHMAVVKDFLVLGNISDPTDGAVPNRVQWSAFNDPTDMDAAAATQADEQDLIGNGGWVQRIVGGEYGVVIQERSIWRMDYVGPPAVFAFSEVEQNRGTPYACSVVNFGNMVFYLGDDGFYMFDGTQSVPIGKNKVDDTMLAELDNNYPHRVNAAIDPVNKLVVWSLPVTGNTGGRPNRQYIYDWANQKWSRGAIEAELVFSGLSVGYTMDGLDAVNTNLDLITISLDSRAWTGGAVQMMGCNSDDIIVTFDGDNEAATVETTEASLVEGHRAGVTSAFILADNAAATLTVGTRIRQADAVSYGGAVSQQANGEVPLNASGRYHRFRISIPAAETWTHIQGVDVPSDAISDEGIS